ncbi:hypothetical protein [Mesonia sp. HuA40]|uniref:hypothetical protein n=1 Tax=Mesonia sp. HuA40 TaxID=2602761 RepID=UPI0011C98C43|nr:hypothetical protein [Mesonia sp. HuA40]TXK70228.1 hypothetical protein FT993_12120 [Mesonia sp. HuA40]
MKNAILITNFILLILFNSCKENQTNKNEEVKNPHEEEQVTVVKDDINLTKLQNSPKFEDAKLQMKIPETNILKAGDNIFSFKVENYELGVTTETAQDLGLANSKKGQHVHFILNNNPYSAHYEEQFSKNLEAGEHTVLAFLSRSYHESVKNKDAFILKKIRVGEITSDNQLDFNVDKPHLFYSRPKGTYSGKDTKRILLDFYLANADLSEDGFKVKAKINGQEFMITEWVPYVIEGLKMGETTIELNFLDKDNNMVDSPYNPVKRTIILEE